MTPKLTTKNVEIYAKLVAGIENDNHDDHKIMTENTQENAKIFNHEKMRYPSLGRTAWYCSISMRQ
jgi:hypothetical protein